MRLHPSLAAAAATWCLATALAAPAHAQDAAGTAATPAGAPAQGTPAPTPPAPPGGASGSDQGTATGTGAATDIGDIVVTARQRSEGLLSVPVAVSALSANDIARYNAVDLTKIGELTPTVIVSFINSVGGGSIAVRGISTPPTQVGFDQAVSVSIDGVQTSNGRIAGVGFFDLKQVEVLKGPQALFFGKNSSAGVISLTSAGPTDHFEFGGRANYEFVGDEATVESHVSGPLTETLGARLAVQYRHLTGWMYNDAQPVANPFYTAAMPAGAARIPGASSRRLGSEDVIGRLTLDYRPSEVFSATLRVFGTHARSEGSAGAFQNIGPCPTGHPRHYGIEDVTSECKVDNHTSLASVPPVVAEVFPHTNRDGTPDARTNVLLTSLDLNLDLGGAQLASITGYHRIHSYAFGGSEATSFGQVLAAESTTAHYFSQQVRASADLTSTLSGIIGGYYEDSSNIPYLATKLRDDQSFNPATGRFDLWDSVSALKGRTLSAFGELRWKLLPRLELAGGVRYSSERKDLRKFNRYGVGALDTTTTVFADSTDKTPGVLASRFRDSNWSPEATLTYNPTSSSTLYVAYKTGFKSGGFALTSPLTRATRINDLNYSSETVRGVEAGAKGLFFDRKLRLTSAIFDYKFKNLQVTNYDPATVAFLIGNAGALKQKGAELEGQFVVNRHLTLTGAATYVHNRYRDFVGQCYGYTVPAAQARTAPAPPNCSFLLNAAGQRVVTAAGTPVLQQDYGGRTPPRSPDWAANAGFIFSTPVSTRLKFELTGNAFYSGSYYAGDSLAPPTLQNSFWRFNASARVIGDDDRWELALIGRNLTNKYYLLFAGDRTGGTGVPLTIGEQRGTVARGREVSLQLNWNFR